MTLSQRNSLAQQFNYACGYCGTTETEAGAALTVDHFRPSSQDGAHAPENWVYCCTACNGFKHNYWSEEEDFALLRPLQDDFSQHWQQNDEGFLLPLTERGRLHIERLHLNRSQLLEKRREHQATEAARTRTRTMEAEQIRLEEQVAQLTRQMFGEPI